MSNWNKIFKPIVVLCVICIVVTGALAATNGMTAPIIEAATLAAQEAARTELLPDAQGFEKVEGIDVANVSDVYRTTNDVGVVITSSAKGYGGDVVVMTAITPDGTIKQIKVTEQAETKGIGSNVATDSFLAQFDGMDGTQNITLGQGYDAYSGATISSKALFAAINDCINCYNELA